MWIWPLIFPSRVWSLCCWRSSYLHIGFFVIADEGVFFTLSFLFWGLTIIYLGKGLL